MIVGGCQLTAQFIVSGAIDIVRTAPSWRGGVAGVMKAARLAEAFGMTCEPHTALYHPLDDFAFGLDELLDIGDGDAYTPTTPGPGAANDWGVIDHATVETV
jgi:L-alanine-DL-glutamate epimerase-like enolase superfamily enzyme